MNVIYTKFYFLGQEGIGDGAGLRLPETFHFLPQELGHFVTRVVPKAIPDESMGKFVYTETSCVNCLKKYIT